MICRAAVACLSSLVALAALESRCDSQSRKVSPPSRYGPSARVEDSIISPDGRTVVYRVGSSTGHTLFAVTDSVPRVLLEGYAGQFLFSPDSRTLLYRTGYDSPLFAVPVDGSAAPRALTPARLVEWGRKVLVSSQGLVVFLGKPAGSDVTYNLYSVSLGARQPVVVQLDGPNQSHGGAWYFDLSPDGAWVAYVADPAGTADYELYLVPITGTAPPRKVSAPFIADGHVQGFRFTPDSQHLVYRANALTLGSTNLFGVAVQGPEPAVRLDAGNARYVEQDYQLSADGQSVVYRHTANDVHVTELFRVPVKGHVAPTRLSAPLVAGGAVRDFALAPDGSVLYRADQEIRTRYELYHVRDGRPPRKLNTPLAPTQDVANFQLAPDGVRTLFVVEPPGSVHLARLDSTGSIPLPDGPTGPVRFPFSISASGEYLVFPEIADTPTNLYLGGLFSLRLDGVSTPLELVPAGPTFSVGSLQLGLADQRVLVMASTGYAVELFSVPVAGGAPALPVNAPLPLDKPLDHVGASDLSPDGRWAVFAFGEYGHGGQQLHAADLALGTPAFELSPAGVTGSGRSTWFRISADSERVVFRSTASELFSVPIDGSAPPLFLDLAPSTAEIQLTPDGEHVLYLDSARRLHGAALDGSHPPVLYGGFDGIGTITFQRLRVSPDGSRVVYQFRGSAAPGTQLFSAPIDGSAPAVRLDPLNQVDRLLGITDGGRVVFQSLAAGSATLRSAPIDGSAAPIPLATATLYQTSQDDAVVLAGDDVVYLAYPNSLFVVPAAGHAAARPIAPGFTVVSASLHSSSTRIYFTAAHQGSSTFDLFELPRGFTTSPVRLSRGTGYNQFRRVVESSDGALAVFLQEASTPTGYDLALHSVPSNGSREPRRLTGALVYEEGEEERIQSDFELSRDGRTVAFELLFDHYYNETATSEVFAVPSNAIAPPHQVSDAPRDQRYVTHFRLDPQGRFALYSGDQEVPGHDELFVAPIRQRPLGQVQR